MRIAIGGFQHETNTFAPVKATFDDFQRQDGWPALSRGDALLTAIDGVHLPVAGAATVLRDKGFDLVPLLWCSATPSAHVDRDAFEQIARWICDDIRAALPLDGIYLDLHGAMVCDHVQDGEGTLLAAIRDIVGPTLPIAVSLDLHANVTEEMVRHASVIEIYRTYPHVDMGDTGARAASRLIELLQGAGSFAKAFRRPDFCIPLNWGCTLVDPAQSLYERVPALTNEEVPSLSVACGFPLADIGEMGPGIVAYGHSQQAADIAAMAMLEDLEDRRTAFSGALFDPRTAVRRAQDMAREANGPVVLADTQDNPGGGGPGDTTGLLRALIDEGARGAVLGLLTDPQCAQTCHETGVGGRLTLALGGKLYPGDTPLVASCTVLALGDGRFTATGPMWGGSRMDLGPMALVETDGVRVIIASKAMQAGDRSMFRHLGLEPADLPIMALKSSVHFRADFQPIAREILIVEAPGPVHADPAKLDFRLLRRGVDLRPGG